MSGSSGELRQQIGEILATVKALDRAQQDTVRHVERAVDGMQRDMASMKHESRNFQHSVGGRLENLKVSQDLLGNRVTTLEQGVEKIRAPVEELVSLRRRLGAIGLLILSATTVLWAFLSPLWNTAAQKIFSAIVR